MRARKRLTWNGPGSSNVKGSREHAYEQAVWRRWTIGWRMLYEVAECALVFVTGQDQSKATPQHYEDKAGQLLTEIRNLMWRDARTGEPL